MYFRKSYNNLSRGNIVRKQKNTVSFPAVDVWAAACGAQRINGTYVKMVTSYATNEEILPNSLQTPAKETNRMIMDRLLHDTSLITSEDRTQAELVRNYYKGLTFKILQGKKLSEFDNNAMVFANRDVIESNYDIAVIASLPASYQRAVKRDNDVRKLENASGGHIGTVGQKVTVNVEVVRSSFSQQYNVYFISGVTTDDQAVFFSYKEPIDSGKLIVAQGTVKRHGENTTQLNRVKVI
jgi:hypothetical protein